MAQLSTAGFTCSPALRWALGTLAAVSLWTAAPTNAQSLAIPDTRVELECEVNPESLRRITASGQVDPKDAVDFLGKLDLVKFRVAFWRTTSGCYGIVGKHAGICVETDNAVSFLYPELPAISLPAQMVYLDRYTGVLQFDRIKNVQHLCVVQQRRF